MLVIRILDDLLRTLQIVETFKKAVRGDRCEMLSICDGPGLHSDIDTPALWKVMARSLVRVLLFPRNLPLPSSGQTKLFQDSCIGSCG
jgi:hypothetical protein